MENKSWLIFIPLIIFVALTFALPAIFDPDEGDTIYDDRFTVMEHLEGIFTYWLTRKPALCICQKTETVSRCSWMQTANR